jgi:hypothetical protein
MNGSTFALTLVFAVIAAVSQPASAAHTGFFPSADSAQQSCPQEEVVWLVLSSMKYYQKAQASFGKGTGVYACLSTARAKSYHEVKDPVADETK